MNTPKNPKSVFDDDDMHELFGGDDVQIPAALDASLLAAAHAAPQASVATSVDSTAPGTADEEKAPTGASIPNERAARAKTYWWQIPWSQGIAAAAVVVLGIAIIPLMLSSPESQLPGELDSIEDVSIAVPSSQAPASQPSLEKLPQPEEQRLTVSQVENDDNAVAELVQAPVPNVSNLEHSEAEVDANALANANDVTFTRESALKAETQLTAEAAADESVAREQSRAATLSAADTNAREISAFNRADTAAKTAQRQAEESVAKIVAEAGASTAEAEFLPESEPNLEPESNSAPEYRQTAKKWLQEIFRLNDAGEKDEARAELKKFLLKHPGSDQLHTLPPDLLE